MAEDALAGAGVTLIYDVRGDARPLSPETVAAVVRVAQEALANVVSHARAHRVRLQLAFGARSLRLKIEDDGDGGLARVVGTTSVTGTATAGDGVYDVDVEI